MPKDQNLLKALDYIDRNITRDICLFDLSSEAGFSVPHFYRLFKRLTGDTVGEYILRRKVVMAAEDLAAGNKLVCSVAMEYGFESHDVFTRAFKRVYGITPNKYRCVKPPPLKRLSLVDITVATNEQQMNYSVLQGESFHVVGIECIATKWDIDGAIGSINKIPTGMSVRRIRSQTFLQAWVPVAVSIPDAYTATFGYAKSLGYEVDFNSFKLLIPIK